MIELQDSFEKMTLACLLILIVVPICTCCRCMPVACVTVASMFAFFIAKLHQSIEHLDLLKDAIEVPSWIEACIDYQPKYFDLNKAKDYIEEMQSDMT